QVVAAVNNALLYDKVKQELQARKESEERFRQLAEHIQEVFWLYDLQDERMTYLSPAFESIYGMSVDEVYENANAWQKVIHPDDVGEVVKVVQRQREGSRTVCEYRVLTTDGGVRWVLDQAFPISNEHGELVRVAGIAANITERKQAEDALRRREAEFKALVENSPDYVARVDTRGRYLYVNPTIVKSTGLSLAEILGKTGKEVNLPDGYVDLDAVVHSGDTQTSIVQITGADGQARYMQVRMVPEPDSSGTVRSVLAITRDLTDLVEAQAELAQLNQTLEQRVAERTALLAEAQRIAHLGSVDIDVERKEATLSEEAWRILRREPTGAPIPLDELISHIHPDDLIDVRNALANAPPDATSFELELRAVRANGSVAHINARAEAISRDDRLVRLLCTALDVTERRKAEEEQRRLTAILEATTDLVANWNLEQKLTFINLGGRQMLGLGLEGTRTDLCLSNIHPEWALQKLQEEGIPVASEQHVWAGESAVLHQEGQEIPVSQVVIAHRDRHGNVEYFSTIMRDMTLQKQAEEALRRSRDDLSAANLVLENAARLKDEFLASMSHELRTPLTSILGLSEALRQQVYGQHNDRQQKSWATIETRGKHLLDLINDILDFSKIEAGQFELHMNLCTVDEICMSALQMIKGMANKKRQTVGFTISPAGMEMEADSRRLKQMLVNLLSNAVKFTPEEGQLGLEVQGDFLEGVVRFQVWDRGIGIAPEDFPRLFEPFTQLDAKLSRQYSGSGLGLSLVRRMAELHGGSVSVESRLGEGSVFTIALPWRAGAVRRRLPQGTGHSLPSDATRHLGERGKNEPPLILLADDNPTNVEMYVEFLSSNGYRLATAEDGLEAVELTAKLRPSLILMDIQMPGMDGLEAIRRIRSSREPGVAHVPIIALTALAMPGDRERCLNAGANDYLSKPISLASMVNMVEAYLTRSGTQ
ncbi:MAG: PAS domain S-box protein, partial [Caldilineaceae bacterium]|nr:PAS domain S-box protein [Caldilineaceae bacterium]